jgi:hypothetical protein
MHFLLTLLAMVLLSSCATTAYNPSFIMSDTTHVEIPAEPITQLEKNRIPHS